ncbi:MAG TPA: hypothetical protein VFE60_06755 [Roseiarcus sp.]|nr:hypothetical protein [Roseiarcus sp.]
MSRSNLQQFVRNHSRAPAALRETRAKMGDNTESRLYALIRAGDYRAISYYLTTQCRDRGYGLPKGAVLNAETTANNFVIGTVNIMSVPGWPVPGGGSCRGDRGSRSSDAADDRA